MLSILLLKMQQSDRLNNLIRQIQIIRVIFWFNILAMTLSMIGFGQEEA
ncbi:hypothetical protein [uncultured Nostoc sp.]|nr:hypothetical protein [uncultured Nostoc sp.]